MIQSLPRAASAHVSALDGVRGIAILLVMLHNLGTVASGPILPGRLLAFAITSGWVGVILFFALSGYLITGILLDSCGREGWWRSFFARRALRIFPLYYVTLLVVLVVLPRLVPADPVLEGLQRQQGWWWSYLSNWALPFHLEMLPLGHFWSLAVEEQFYILWPVAVAGLSRRGLYRLCLGILVVALGCRIGMRLDHAPALAVYTFTFARMDSLAVGGVVALLVREVDGTFSLRRWAGLAGVILLAVILGTRGLSHADPWVQTVGFTTLTLLSGSLLWWLVASQGGGVLRNLLASRPLRFFGKYSYALYVFHPLVHWIALRRFALEARLATGSRRSQLGLALAYLVIAFGLTIALALLSWMVVERPFLRLKRHFPVGKR